jgi:uncharacterized protein
MSSKIFVNIAVKDLQASKEFFRQLGYTFNPQFTNEDGACLIISEDIYAMLLVEKFFKTFTAKEVADAHQNTEVIIALSVEKRELVDEMVTKAIKAGGRIYRQAEDQGFMYGHSFEDLDGHQWEVFWMDPAHLQY